MENTKEEIETKIELAIVQKDIGQIRDDIKELKSEISNVKDWAVKAFWIVATAIILQITNFILNGGLSVITKQ